MESRIRAILSRHKKVPIQDPAVIRAAVLIPLFKKNGQTHLLFTRRTEKVAYHKKQISFPGGRQDPGEDLLTTALREAQEEMGIEPKDVTLLGELDDVCTVSSPFCISPFVALIPYPYSFQINRDEIDGIIEIPIAAFLHEAKFRQEIRDRNGRLTPVYFYEYQGDTIWGATARILKQLVDLIYAPNRRKGKREDKNRQDKKRTAELAESVVKESSHRYRVSKIT
jgi:8-oxo-dGTP pyrophosphatase MutT (NUDIX family)